MAADSLSGMGRALSAIDTSVGSRVEPRLSGGGPLLLVVVVAAAAATVAAVVVEVAGRGAFPTHPVSALALSAAAVAVWMATSTMPRRSLVALRALSMSLLAYLWLGVAACLVDDRILAGLWSAGWIPVNGLIVVAGLVVAAMPRSALALSVVTALVAVAAAMLAEPTRPFEGLPTAAPESWTTRVPWLADILLAVFCAALIVALVGIVVRALRAHVTERRHLVNCAATTSLGAGLIVMCVALAALRDPGDIDPSTGSVAYIVAIALTATVAAYGQAASRWPLRVVFGYWATAIAFLVGVQATGITPVALGVAVTVGVACAGMMATVASVVWLERWLTLEPPRLVTNILDLSPRENEVLAAVAAGATNAGVAADLFLSERTVEQHLRSTFRKLNLGEHDSSNRRIRAAAIWWQYQARTNAQSVDDLA